MKNGNMTLIKNRYGTKKDKWISVLSGSKPVTDKSSRASLFSKSKPVELSVYILFLFTSPPHSTSPPYSTSPLLPIFPLSPPYFYSFINV